MDFSTIFDGLLNMVYPEVVIGITVLSMIFVRSLGTSKWVHPKWVVFGLATFAGIIQFFFVPEFNFWKSVNSVGIAVLGYDYFVKIIKDLLEKRNPFKDQA